VADNVGQVLAEVEMSPAESPAQLRARADALMADFRQAVDIPPRLAVEAAGLRARAGAVERAGAAREPVAQAEAAVAAAADVYAATAAPEIEATRRAVAARQGFEGARDALQEAQRARAEPAHLVELELRAEAAARVDAHEQGALGDAQAARAAARRDLAAARGRLESAAAGLAAAEAAVGDPASAGIPAADLYAGLLHCWPSRVLHALAGDGPPLGDAELEACRDLARRFADLLGVVPAGAAQRLEQRAAAAALKEVRQRMHQVAIAGPGGQALNLGQLMGLPAGAAGG
jgi:hypothetical protein